MESTAEIFQTKVQDVNCFVKLYNSTFNSSMRASNYFESIKQLVLCPFSPQTQ